MGLRSLPACSPRPWAHVTLTQRAALRAAYAAVLRDRLALSAPLVAIRCPSGGCLLCGISSVDRAAIEGASRGGTDAVSHAVRRSVSTTPPALGGRGREAVHGHVCPACATAIEGEGAVGHSARGRALVAYVHHSSAQKAKHLRLMLTDHSPPSLPAWVP
jgi:hypothetical protein